MKTNTKNLARAAQQYRNNHHWVTLQLQGKSPDCMGKNWQKRKLADAIPNFKPGDNIGILLGEPSGGLVRLDPDFPSIADVTEILFPEATAVFDRKSSPGSGRLYVCKGLKTTNFKLPNVMKKDARLPLHDDEPNLIVFQVLSTGAQTVAPPSIHPSGEAIHWVNAKTPPKTLEQDELLRRVGIEAFLMAVTHFWPARGTRNEAAWSLARVLLETLATQIPDDEQRIAVVDELVLAVAMAGGDGEASRKGKQRAAATLEKMKAGEQTTGLTRLLELLELPKGTKKTFRNWLGLQQQDDDSRPTIRLVGGEIAKATDHAEAALAAAAAVTPIMVRAGHLVQPIIDTVPAAHGHKTEVTLLRALQAPNVVYLLNKHAAKFTRYDARSEEWVTIDPPTRLAVQLLGKGKWQFPKVSGIVTTPTLQPDGSLLDQAGYDPATQLWLAADSQLKMPEIAERPTRKQAEQALALFDGLLKNFPFVEPVDRSVALAAILTAVLRGAFDVAPMFLFIAFEPGSGKSYLVNLISTIARGRMCPVITNVESSEEMEKRLGALVLEGTPMISLDNCSANIGGDLLCQITEQRLIKIRILGKSETPECEWRGVLFGTGNNVTLYGDMTRRGLLSHLDPKLERPEQRKFNFDPIKRVLAHRGDYIAAAITIARAYIAAGRPKVCGPLGSYEEWGRMVRSPLTWLGLTDPVESMEKAREDDPANTALRDLISFWKETLLKKTGYTASALIAHVEQNVKVELGKGHLSIDEFKHPEFRDLLLQQAGNDHGGIDPQKLGSWLTTIKGKVRDGHRIELVRKSKHGNCYALTKV